MTSFDLKQVRDDLWQALRVSANQTPFAREVFQATLQQLSAIDRFWAYPGRDVLLQLAHYMEREQMALGAQLVNNCCYQLQRGAYRRQTFRPFQTHLEQLDRPILHDDQQLEFAPISPRKPYFEVLVVHPFPDDYRMLYQQQLATFKTEQDEFLFDIVLVDSAQDALTAVLANSDIQACVYLNHIVASNVVSAALFMHYSSALVASTPPPELAQSVELNLCRSLRCLRPELNHYLISEQSAAELPLDVRRHFDRVLFHLNPFHDLHMALLAGVRNRFSTPFFDALQAYSRQPKSVFHALPLSRGASVKDSPWIHDMLDFYGDHIFLSETSSTQGGLDSLLDPTGAIKQAHTKAAETFGADSSFFVTGGTSTANKIVILANVLPGDIVLISADCHKSVAYSVMLAGAYPIFLETYSLAAHDLYGGVDLARIKAAMLDLKAQGRLHRLRQITLTNSTFDGLIYHCEKFMMEILALKPDVIFHWDEAWFAFAYFHPLYHSRTAMSAVHKIRNRLANPAYQQFYSQWAAEFDANEDPQKWRQTLYPDPALVRLRVYSTQSTHKTLSAFRQGSMIHVADADYCQSRFLEAFRAHTSSSPNYQIIASLDLGRRQAALEGFHRVRQAILLSVQLRQRIRASPALEPYFEVLGEAQLIPSCYRHGRADDSPSAMSALSTNWGESEFVIDPTRVTLNVSKTGIVGSSFRQLLMTRYDIQVNKTSRHTVLFLINIGSTQATIDYLLQVLTEMAAKFQYERRNRPKPVAAVAMERPQQRSFHASFMPFASGAYQACDIRAAYFDGLDDANVGYLPLSSDTVEQAQAGQQWVSASFVTPYPPGFPVVVPGQLITTELLTLFQYMAVKEIHGFCFERGFKVFSEAYLQGRSAALTVAG